MAFCLVADTELAEVVLAPAPQRVRVVMPQEKWSVAVVVIQMASCVEPSGLAPRVTAWEPGALATAATAAVRTRLAPSSVRLGGA